MVFAMFKMIFSAAVVSMFASLPFSASALEFDMTQFKSDALADSQTDYSNIKAANIATVFAIEDFEGFAKVGQIGSVGTTKLTTAVGSFTTLGSRGSGNTAIDENNAKGANRGKNIAIRQNGDTHDNGGRQNTSFNTSSDKTYLDSNDTLGFKWVASAGGEMFDRLLFTLTDPGDSGKRLTISAVGFTETFTIAPGQRNGDIFNFLIAFSAPVSTATLSLAKSGTNDGFSIDNIIIGAVPLPAAAWLLLGVTGALFAAKRRSTRKPA